MLEPAYTAFQAVAKPSQLSRQNWWRNGESNSDFSVAGRVCLRYHYSPMVADCRVERPCRGYEPRVTPVHLSAITGAPAGSRTRSSSLPWTYAAANVSGAHQNWSLAADSNRAPSITAGFHRGAAVRQRVLCAASNACKAMEPEAALEATPPGYKPGALPLKLFRRNL